MTFVTGSHRPAERSGHGNHAAHKNLHHDLSSHVRVRGQQRCQLLRPPTGELDATIRFRMTVLRTGLRT
jgi:hypothetical protein